MNHQRTASMPLELQTSSAYFALRKSTFEAPELQMSSSFYVGTTMRQKSTFEPPEFLLSSKNTNSDDSFWFDAPRCPEARTVTMGYDGHGGSAISNIARIGNPLSRPHAANPSKPRNMHGTWAQSTISTRKHHEMRKGPRRERDSTTSTKPKACILRRFGAPISGDGRGNVLKARIASKMRPPLEEERLRFHGFFARTAQSISLLL